MDMIDRLFSYGRIFSCGSAFCLFLLSCSGGMTTTEIGGNTYQKPAEPMQPLPQPPVLTPYMFGLSTAISGDTMVVGAQYDSSDETGVKNGTAGEANGNLGGSGAAYVYRKIGNDWVQEAYLKGSGTSIGDIFGTSVAISADTIVVGAFKEDSNETGVKNGTTGGTNDLLTDSGAAYVFRRTGNLWTQEAYLKGSATSRGDRFGRKVAISGDTIIVGAAEEDSNETGVKNGATGGTNDLLTDSGAAYVFRRTGNLWAQEAYLKASSTDSDDQFGYSVAISGDTIVVGARLEEDPGDVTLNSGAAYVFRRTGALWAQEAYLKNSGISSNGNFGSSLAIAGDTIVVGALYEDSNEMGVKNGIQGGINLMSTDSGAAYVFKRTGTFWVQEAYLKSSNPFPSSYFGQSVSISGDTIVVGSDLEDSDEEGVKNGTGGGLNNLRTCSGAAYVFKRAGNLWSQEAYLKGLGTSNWDRFGSSVAVSGDSIMVGAPYEASDELGIKNGPFGGLNDLWKDSGAAYGYTRTGNTWASTAFFKRSN